MELGLSRLRRSKTGRVVATMAVLSLVVLFPSYCELVDTADAAPMAQHDHDVDHGHGHAHNGVHGSDNCPSLEHTPLASVDAVPLAVPDLSPVFVVAQETSLGINTLRQEQWIVPPATPPPIQSLPLYLRYAHLLM
jgi:hypothetical protein